MAADKKYIDATQLFESSLRLAADIIQSGFRPNFIVGIWRGGTPVGIVVQELLDYYGIKSDHIAIRTSSYLGMERRSGNVYVEGLGYVVQNAQAEDALLIVDDVYDTGLSIEAVIGQLQERSRRNTPERIRIATPWFKPSNNKTSREPDFYVHRTDDWLVFPHELDGLSYDEAMNDKPGMRAVLESLGPPPVASD